MPIEFGALSDTEVGAGQNLYDPVRDREVKVLGAVAGSAGSRFLIVTNADGSGYGGLVDEGEVRDSWEARPNLSPEQRQTREKELSQELDALRAQDKPPESPSEPVAPVAPVQDSPPGNGPENVPSSVPGSPLTGADSGPATDATVTTGSGEGSPESSAGV